MLLVYNLRHKLDYLCKYDIKLEANSEQNQNANSPPTPTKKQLKKNPQIFGNEKQ